MDPSIFSNYGLYMCDSDFPPVWCINITGFSGMLATKILGEPWQDDYTEYMYHKGDENFVEIFIITEIVEDFGLYLGEDENEF